MEYSIRFRSADMDTVVDVYNDSVASRYVSIAQPKPFGHAVKVDMIVIEEPELFKLAAAIEQAQRFFEAHPPQPPQPPEVSR
jgi:hypothetical protein